MTKRGQNYTWSDRKTRDEYEQREVAIYQAQTAGELRVAYDALTGRDDTHILNVRRMYGMASPAGLVTLALRGYELPDARTRLESNRALLTLANQLEELDLPGGVTEQFWLMLAQQQDILLLHIEQDLEAMLTGTGSAVEREQTLTTLYALIRSRCAMVVDALWTTARPPQVA